jgi:hypothetical protein
MSKKVTGLTETSRRSVMLPLGTKIPHMKRLNRAAQAVCGFLGWGRAGGTSREGLRQVPSDRRHLLTARFATYQVVSARLPESEYFWPRVPA